MIAFLLYFKIEYVEIEYVEFKQGLLHAAQEILIDHSFRCSFSHCTPFTHVTFWWLVIVEPCHSMSTRQLARSMRFNDSSLANRHD